MSMSGLRLGSGFTIDSIRLIASESSPGNSGLSLQVFDSRTSQKYSGRFWKVEVVGNDCLVGDDGT